MKKSVNPYLKQLGERIRILREEKNMSQEEFAESVGTKHTQIGRIERAERNSSILVLKKIADALGVSVSIMLDFEDKNKRNKN